MQVYVAAIVAPHTRGTQVWIGTLPAHYIMPLRRLHDSGTGYKYPNLLTYLHHGCISTAAHVWNSLPTAVQSSESLDIFRRRLKTELFERSYNWHRACQTTLLLCDSLSPSRSFLLWLQPWSLSTIMLLWHSFLIINNNNNGCLYLAFTTY